MSPQLPADAVITTPAPPAAALLPAALAPAQGIAADAAHANTAPHSDRYRRGLEQLLRVDGQTGVDVVAQLAQAFPEFATLLVEFPFGDIYPRAGLGLRERELTVVAALTALGNAAPQLRVHIHAALHVGCTPREIVEVVMQMAVYAGFPVALNALASVREVFAQTGIGLPLPSATP